jgi:ABC-type bacteriocin/lantibiotic exporter with double-glycine peptidase domain
MTGPLEKLRPGRRWFESANRRIADFAGERGADDAAAPQSIARIILDTAAAWSSIRAPEGDVEDLGSAEAVMSFAAQRGVAARFETGKAASLQASDFPLATLTHSGEARLLTGRDGARFSALASGSAYEIDLSTLQAEETGTIVLLRPSDRSAFGEADVADSATAAAIDPVREALNYVIQRQRPLLVKLLLAAAFSNLMLLAVPIYTSVVFDRVIPHSAWETMWAISIGVGLALVADFAVRWARLKLQDAIATTASATLQAATFRRLVEVRMAEAPRSASSVMMRLREVEGLTQLAPQFIAGVVVDAPFLVLVFALIWVNGGPVVFAPVVGLVMLAALHHFADLASHAAHIRSSKLSQVQTKHLFETAESLEAVKAARSERKALSRFDQFYDEYAYSAHLARAWSGLAAYANMTVGQMMIVLVMVIGVFQVSQGGMTVGGLSACILLVGRIISPIGQLITVINRMRLSRSTLKSLSQDTSGQTEAGGDASGAAIPPRIATLRLSEACYRYPEQAGAQLDKVSLTIQPGEKVAVIGRSRLGQEHAAENARAIHRTAGRSRAVRRRRRAPIRAVRFTKIHRLYGAIAGSVRRHIARQSDAGARFGRSATARRRGAPDRRRRIRRASSAGLRHESRAARRETVRRRTAIGGAGAGSARRAWRSRARRADIGDGHHTRNARRARSQGVCRRADPDRVDASRARAGSGRSGDLARPWPRRRRRPQGRGAEADVRRRRLKPVGAGSQPATRSVSDTLFT